MIVGGVAQRRRLGHRRQRGNRQPEVRAETDVDGAAVIGRTDADDRHRHAFNPDDASDDGWVRAEHAGPRLMPEDGDERSPAPLLCLVEPAAERRPESQDVEIGRRRVLDDRIADGAVVEIADGVRNAGGHRRRKDVGVLRHLHVGGIRGDDERPARAVVLIDVDEAIGVGERLFTEQHRVHEAEDRGVGADGEAEDQHRRRGETPIAHEAAEAVARVARRARPRAAVPRASRLASLICSTPPNSRRAWRRASSRDRPLACRRSVSRSRWSCSSSFRSDSRPPRKKERSQPAVQDVPDAHGYVLCNTRLTPADRRSHFATSASSCLRPAFVSE